MRKSERGVTRRRMAAVVAAVPALAQNAARPVDEIEAARGQLKQSSGALRKFKVATTLEPSFVFKV